MNWRMPHTALTAWQNRHHLNCHTRKDHTEQCQAFEEGADYMLISLKRYADGKWVKLDTDKDGNIVVFLEADREVN